jgi:hypothetical protein
VLGAAAALLVVLAGVRAFGAAAAGRSGEIRGSRATVKRVVPSDTRIRVEVLNATDVRGLAREATRVLRDAGFDVVFYGNETRRLDSTIVLDRASHPDWADLAARVLQRERREARPDSTRLVDLSVLVGRDWAPPSQPFRP